jgi:hypothetical protein
MCTMLPAKKTPVTRIRIDGIREELKLLYARRSAIDSLIESLVSYDRYRASMPDRGKQQTA